MNTLMFLAIFFAVAGFVGALAFLFRGEDSKTDAPAAPGAALPVILLERLRITHIRVHWEDETVKPTFKGELVLDARGDEIATFSRPQPPSFSLRLASPAESQHGNADELVSPWISGCERAPAGSCRRQGTV